MNINVIPNSPEKVRKVKSEKSNILYIYWSRPANAFGDISYRIIDANTGRTITTIQFIPYEIKLLSSNFRSIQIVTISEIDNKVNESNPSEKIDINK